jgi:hypothetical protein
MTSQAHEGFTDVEHAYHTTLTSVAILDKNKPTLSHSVDQKQESHQTLKPKKQFSRLAHTNAQIQNRIESQRLSSA